MCTKNLIIPQESESETVHGRLIMDLASCPKYYFLLFLLDWIIMVH